MSHWFDNVSFLEDLSEEERETITSTNQVRQFAAGEVILKQGDRSDSFYLILEGHVSILKNNTPHPIATLGPRCVFGEVAFLSKKKRIANIIADSDVAVIEFTSASFAALPCETKYKIQKKLFEIVVLRLDKMNDMLTSIISIFPKDSPYICQ